MGSSKQSILKVACPCCGAKLTIDPALERIIAHEASKQKRSTDEADRLERVGDLLERQAEQREAHFRESAEEEKIKSELLARKFEESLKKTRDEPVSRPLRDIDLD